MLGHGFAKDFFVGVVMFKRQWVGAVGAFKNDFV